MQNVTMYINSRPYIIKLLLLKDCKDHEGLAENSYYQIHVDLKVGV
jgi:hypothetical protein